MTRIARWLTIPSLLLLPVVATGQAGRFSETTTVTQVEIPVQVTRDGKPVRDLTAKDFEVFDGKKKRDIVGFEVVDLSRQAPEAESVTEVPVSGRRHFLLLFDLSFSDPTAILRAREAAEKLIAERLHPSDLIGVATYSQARGVELPLGFTSDRWQVKVAIDTLGRPDVIANRTADPLKVLIAEAQGGPEASVEGGFHGGSSLGGGRTNRDGIILEQLKDLSTLSSKANRNLQKAQILALTNNLADLAGMLSKVQGRKYVLYLSEGFDSSILLGTQDIQRTKEIASATESGEYWKVDSEERYGSGEAQSALNQVFDAFHRADCAIEAIDIGGLRAGADLTPRPSGEDGLFAMASGTGGNFYRNYNDLGAAMDQMLESTSVTYLLAIQPDDVKPDGSFHKLRVKLAGDAAGAEVSYRPGYFAPRPYSEESPGQRRLEAAGMILGGQPGGAIDTAVLAAAFPGSMGTTAYVPVLIEIDGASLVGGVTGDKLPTEIYAYAFDQKGDIADYFAQSMALDLQKVGAALEKSGFKFWGHLDLPPGEYRVRVLVRNGLTGTAGLRAVAVTVPTGDRAAPLLLPPFFPEPQGRWLLGREVNAEQQDVPYPFMAQGQPFIPAARPQVEAGSSVKVVLAGYHLGEGQAALDTELVDAQGKVVPGGGDVEVSGRETGDDGVEHLLAVFRPAAKLKPGLYTLEVKLAGDGEGGGGESSIPVEIVG